METKSYGKLINNDGHGHYTKPDSTENLIRYITRTNKQPSNDLITWGGMGISEYSGIEKIIDQFSLAQKMHTRCGTFGRYMSHEYFSFSDKGEYLISKYHLDIDTIARKMAADIFEHDHCQVIYGVHSPSSEDKHLHIHFAINAVNYRTGSKRRENRSQTRERDMRFNQIIIDELSKQNTI